MNWELSDCRNLSELADQVTALEKTSVIHFSFLMTVILTLVFMFIYHRRSVDKSLLQFMIVSSFIFYVLNVIRLAFFPIPINDTYIELLKSPPLAILCILAFKHGLSPFFLILSPSSYL